MPAAAVIPAPIAYIKVVAVKKLVVGSLLAHRPCPFFKKLECSRQAARLNNAAWNNGIGPRFYFVGFSGPEVMIKRDSRGHSYCGVRDEILG